MISTIIIKIYFIRPLKAFAGIDLAALNSYQNLISAICIFFQAAKVGVDKRNGKKIGKLKEQFL
ncbi:MAG: hypothetical protein ABIN36_00060 [Ferruginibacter sp.]